MIAGHDRAVDEVRRAWNSRALHHAWLLAGPRGVGKAHFARTATLRILAEAAGPAFDGVGLATPHDHRIARFLEAGSHPDMRWLERLEDPKKPGTLFRNIKIEQVRQLSEFLNLTPALSDWRVVVIDTIDELEPGAANALLKMLEEPPPRTVFFLVSHAPGRLLATIRSRCRRLDFRQLEDDAMASILAQHLPDTTAAERQRLIDIASGSVGRALATAKLDLATLEAKAVAILNSGDPYNEQRVALADELGRMGATDRYRAFLELVPSLLVREARSMPAHQRERALSAYERMRELTVVAPRLSLDPAATVFQLGGILASAAPRLP
ncbi:MAG: DNA polymerase III subunit delta' [Sphingomicrobium sp.]